MTYNTFQSNLDMIRSYLSSVLLSKTFFYFFFSFILLIIIGLILFMEEKKEVKDQKVKVIVTPILLPGGPNGNGNGKDDKDKDKKKNQVTNAMMPLMVVSLLIIRLFLRIL